jgi:hypothetical protein
MTALFGLKGKPQDNRRELKRPKVMLQIGKNISHSPK